MIHKLKILTEHFEELLSGNKKAEIRYNDRKFKVGDTLILEEYLPETNEFTGRKVSRKVTHILNDRTALLATGYVCLSLKEFVENSVILSRAALKEHIEKKLEGVKQIEDKNCFGAGLGEGAIDILTRILEGKFEA